MKRLSARNAHSQLFSRQLSPQALLIQVEQRPLHYSSIGLSLGFTRRHFIAMETLSLMLPRGIWTWPVHATPSGRRVAAVACAGVHVCT